MDPSNQNTNPDEFYGIEDEETEEFQFHEEESYGISDLDFLPTSEYQRW